MFQKCRVQDAKVRKQDYYWTRSVGFLMDSDFTVRYLRSQSQWPKLWFEAEHDYLVCAMVFNNLLVAIGNMQLMHLPICTRIQKLSRYLGLVKIFRRTILKICLINCIGFSEIILYTILKKMNVLDILDCHYLGLDKRWEIMFLEPAWLTTGIK